MRRITALVLTLATLALIAAAALAVTIVTTPNGTWTAYPGQSQAFQTSVQQPINLDGSSNFPNNGRAVIPVKFSLQSGVGPFRFESVYSDNVGPVEPEPANQCFPNYANDCAYLSWRPSAAMTFAELTHLSALYAFADGGCAGGSLRWTVRLQDTDGAHNLDIHYQPGTGGVGQQICQPGTSGQNMIGLGADESEWVYVTQNFPSHIFPRGYNNTYADTVAQLGSLPVITATLIVDSGWGANGDQVVDLTSATVGTAGYSQTFTPLAAQPLTSTCTLPPATIKVTKIGGSPSGQVNEPVSVQPNDTNGSFRQVDCKYMYNLATSSLSGTGKYQVDVVIGGVPAAGPAIFDIR